MHYSVFTMKYFHAIYLCNSDGNFLAKESQYFSAHNNFLITLKAFNTACSRAETCQCDLLDVSNDSCMYNKMFKGICRICRTSIATSLSTLLRLFINILHHHYKRYGTFQCVVFYCTNEMMP